MEFGVETYIGGIMTNITASPELVGFLPTSCGSDGRLIAPSSSFNGASRSESRSGLRNSTAQLLSRPCRAVEMDWTSAAGGTPETKRTLNFILRCVCRRAPAPMRWRTWECTGNFIGIQATSECGHRSSITSRRNGTWWGYVVIVHFHLIVCFASGIRNVHCLERE